MPRKPIFRNPKKELAFRIERQHADGRAPWEKPVYSFLIAANEMPVKSSVNGSVYMVCDIDQKFPATIMCDGYEHPVKVVLKVYARIPQKVLERQRRERRYRKLLRGQPMWNEQ